MAWAPALRDCFNLVDLGPPPLSSFAGWLSDCAPSLGPRGGGARPLCHDQESFRVCSFLPPLSNTCMQRPLGGCHPPSCPAPDTLLCCLSGSPRLSRPPLTIDQSGPPFGSHHTSVCKLAVIRLGFKGWVPVRSPGCPVGTGQGQALEASSSFSLLLSAP